MKKVENQEKGKDEVQEAGGDRERVDWLISELNCDEMMRCQNARRELVAMGGRVVGPLTKALSSKKQWVRWEAAKALGQIGDPAAVQTLINALEDREFDVRWLAAEALINIGRKSVVPLLKTLLEDPNSVWLRQGAHHVLRDMRKSDELSHVLRPVLAALEGGQPALEVPAAVKTALSALTKK